VEYRSVERLVGDGERAAVALHEGYVSQLIKPTGASQEHR
jgi:hypothetical protein